VQRQQLKGVISGSAADGDGSYEVIKPNSRVLLPIELDYTIAELDSIWQWCGADEDAEALCATQSMVIVVECLWLTLALEVACFTSRTCQVDRALS
jgi:hypothetical protein